MRASVNEQQEILYAWQLMDCDGHDEIKIGTKELTLTALWMMVVMEVMIIQVTLQMV